MKLEIKSKFIDYIKYKEVVYHVYNGIIEISNGEEEVNRMNLLNYLSSASSIDVYEKDHWYIKDDFQNIDEWSQKDDVLFLLETIGVLVCITRKEAIENDLIAV